MQSWQLGMGRADTHQSVDYCLGDGLLQLRPHMRDVGRHMDGDLAQVSIGWRQIVIHDLAHCSPCTTIQSVTPDALQSYRCLVPPGLG